jgi:hypothetical protein
MDPMATHCRKLIVTGIYQAKIKGESTSVKVLPWDTFATFNVAVLISNIKQGFTFELEEGRVVIGGFVNEINNKLCVVPKARTLQIKK